MIRDESVASSIEHLLEKGEASLIPLDITTPASVSDSTLPSSQAHQASDRAEEVGIDVYYDALEG